MSDDNTDYNAISAQAERELNSSANAGPGRGNNTDDSGVDTSVENRFPGAQVKVGDDLVTNAGYDRKIPEDEGGDIDAKGRSTRGRDFEGEGGPEDDAAARRRDQGGENDPDLQQFNGREPSGRNDTTSSGDILDEGRAASNANTGGREKIGGSNFKGEDYVQAEDTPDSTADQGNVPPDSVTEMSQ